MAMMKNRKSLFSVTLFLVRYSLFLPLKYQT